MSICHRVLTTSVNLSNPVTALYFYQEHNLSEGFVLARVMFSCSESNPLTLVVLGTD